MRVAIDTNALFVTQAGVARYIRGLQCGLRRVAADDVVLSEVAWPVTNFSYQQPYRALKTAYRELYWALFRAPKLISKQQADVFHTTGPLRIVPPASVKHVVTLHDLAVLRHPERFRRWCRHSTRRSLQQLHDAHTVLCISQFTADEANALLGLPLNKLKVVYNGCDFQQGAEEQKPEFNVPADFFLFVGSLEPGKNLALLRQVYLNAEAQMQPLPPLMIVGARWEGVANEGVAPQNWHYLGRVPDTTLVYLYRRAIALLFPSKYEGFGLPVVEAMTLGCPVICSPVASLPEVAGNAALLPELDPIEYRNAMCLILSNHGLRAELIQRGISQATKFSWDKCARETIDVYRESLHR